jgi:S1-C subfamily serine protease
MGVIFLGMGQAEGLLTEVRQTTYGKAVQATLQSKSGSPAWTGAVATNEAGALLGIVTQSGVGETHLVPIDAMRGAWERVLARGASVPQPWLGVRGDAAATVPLPLWVENGWKPETITSLMKDMQGVLLTSVAPGTPAALAGLRPGDVISRVGERDVRGVEDLSMFLKEAGVGSKLDFTVHRAMEASPLKFPVILSGTQNPALATAEAEVRAARSALYAAEAERRAMQLKEQRLRTDNHAAALAELRAHLLGIEQKLEHARSQTFQAEKRAALARLYATGAAGGSFAPLPRIELSIRPLQLVGLEVIGLTARSAPRLNAKSGVLVVSVRPGSPADTSGLRAGDVIETINNQTFTRLTLNDKLRNASAASLSVGVVREGKRIALTLGPVGAPPAP